MGLSHNLVCDPFSALQASQYIHHGYRTEYTLLVDISALAFVLVCQKKIRFTTVIQTKKKGKVRIILCSFR